MNRSPLSGASRNYFQRIEGSMARMDDLIGDPLRLARFHAWG
jgi:hypothetical protein